METSSISDWGAAVVASVGGAFAMLLAAVPRIIGFLLILAIGWFIAGLIAKGVGALLRAVRFNELAQRAGIADFVDRMGLRTDSAGLLATVSKWFIRLIALVVAFDALGLPAVSGVLHQFLLWVPNLIVAMVVLVIAGLAANAFARLVRGATDRANLGNPALFATIARVAVWSFGALVAVHQIGVATELVTTLFVAIVGCLALALGLAFGLGGRETAAQIVSHWYDRASE